MIHSCVRQMNVLFGIIVLFCGCGVDHTSPHDMTDDGSELSRDMSDLGRETLHDLSDYDQSHVSPEDHVSRRLLCSRDREGQEMTLHIRQLAPIHRVVPGENVLVENGFNYLIVTERCEFWSWNGTGTDRVWASVSHGTLSEAQRLAIVSDLDLESWSALDEELFIEAGVHDAPTWAMTHGEISWGTRCIDCDAKVIQAITWIEKLHAQGTFMMPDTLRLIVQRISPEDLAVFNKPTTASPPGLDLDAVAHPYEHPPQECGQGVLIEDASLITQLLEIRARYTSGQMGGFWYQFIPLEDADGTIYKVHFRETTPFENTHGLVESSSYFGTCL